MLEVDHFGGCIEVCVVVHDGEAVFSGEDRGEQVSDADGAGRSGVAAGDGGEADDEGDGGVGAKHPESGPRA